jgi:putative membrane protein
MRRSATVWITAAAIVLVAACAKTEDRQQASSEQGRRPAAVGAGGAGANLKSDDAFVRDVANKSMAEAELSRMALDKSTDARIKAFAQRMIHEHGDADKALRDIASGQAIEWPAQLDESHQKTVDELASKQGTEFDRAYVKAMIEGHRDLAAKLESRLDVQSVADWKTAAAARTQSNALPEPRTDMRDVQVRPDKSDNATTTKINRWAADAYPVAQQHLDAATALDNAITKP